MQDLTTIHPAMPYALATAFAFVAVYLIRRWEPHAWEWVAEKVPGGPRVAKVAQALPSIMLAALASAYLAGGGYRDAVVGAVLGAVNPLVHEFLKASPLPYLGGRYPAASKADRADYLKRLDAALKKLAKMGAVFLVVLVAACSSTSDVARYAHMGGVVAYTGVDGAAAGIYAQQARITSDAIANARDTFAEQCGPELAGQCQLKAYDELMAKWEHESGFNKIVQQLDLAREALDLLADAIERDDEPRYRELAKQLSTALGIVVKELRLLGVDIPEAVDGGLKLVRGLL